MSATSEFTPVNTVVEKLFGKYHSMLLKYLSDRLPDKDEVEDLAQEVYYRIARKPDLHNIEFPKAFLIRIAKNLLIDLNRARQRVKSVTPYYVDPELSETHQVSICEGPESDLYAQQLLKTLTDALAELSPKCRAVFIMNRVEGITYCQIAADLNMSEAMVGKYMRRALAHLMQQAEIIDEQ